MDEETRQYIKKLEESLKEQRLFSENLQQEIEKLKNDKLQQNRINVPFLTTNVPDVKEFNILKIYKLYGGIPIYTTKTNLTGFDGQMFLINATTTTPSKRFAVQIGNTVSSVALT